MSNQINAPKNWLFISFKESFISIKWWEIKWYIPWPIIVIHPNTAALCYLTCDPFGACWPNLVKINTNIHLSCTTYHFENVAVIRSLQITYIKLAWSAYITNTNKVAHSWWNYFVHSDPRLHKVFKQSKLLYLLSKLTTVWNGKN